jgi:hypothetical protein
MHWTGLIHALLGLWLISSPFTFGYSDHALIMSDLVSGGLAIVFGLMAVRRPLFGWGAAMIGLWLQFAPLVFWAPQAVIYVNDTVIGLLLLVFSVVIHGIPGAPASRGPEIPPGWSYNPSAYVQRIPIIALNFVAWFIARYLAAYQLGYIDTIWDPFFGDGTSRVLESVISKSLPVSDAGLGAIAYTIEALTGFGDTRRWHTTPWLVLFFGILVVPVSSISILLIILQPMVVGAWCSLCIITAGLMLLMIPFALDEVVAVLQFLRRSKKQGLSLWSTLWKGVSLEGGPADHRSPAITAPVKQLFQAMRWGVSIPWNLSVSVLFGIGAITTGAYIPGALVVVFSVISCSEVARKLRFVNIPLGAWAMLGHPLLGIAIIALSFRRGRIKEKMWY